MLMSNDNNIHSYYIIYMGIARYIYVLINELTFRSIANSTCVSPFMTRYLHKVNK